MGYATVSDLDELTWKYWPKTPTFLYVDICEGVRLVLDTLARGEVKYGIRVDHAAFDNPYISRHLTKRQLMYELKKINKVIPILPLLRPSPYEPIDL